jgi:hypothetical protein
MRRKIAVLFLKKKHQKNFCSMGDVARSRVKTDKSFCGAFFKKRPLALTTAL